MATMNVSLPDRMKQWVEEQAGSSRYANASDYVRDLIRRDQERAERLAALQALVDEARSEPALPVSMETVIAEARRKVAGR